MIASNLRASSAAADSLFLMTMTSSKSGLASKHPAKRASTATEIRKPGKYSLRTRTGLVNSRQSPMDRRRMRRMCEHFGRLRNRSLVFNRCFIDHHDGYVVLYGVNPVACAAFQSLSALGESHRSFAERTNEDLE